MRGFLGVPIVLRGRAYGNLYLTEKVEGPFTDEDQELVETLASQAAVAIENARLYESATNWSAQLEALNEVGAALAGEIELPRLLKLISRRLRGLINARVVTIALPTPHGTLRVEAADGDAADEVLGLQLERVGSKSGGVLERRRAERVDSRTIPKSTRRPPARSVLARVSMSLFWPAAARSASSASTTRKAKTLASATTTCALLRPSPRAPRLPSTFRPVSPATRCAGSSKPKSWNVGAWRVSSTTRPVRS